MKTNINNRKYLIILGVVFWTILLVVGFLRMTDYSYSPGVPAIVSAKLPKNIFTTLDKNLPKLLVFLHPKCPCSKATLGELTNLIESNPNLAEVIVIFLKPDNESDEWVKTSLWEKASRISSIKLVMMDDEEISQFGVITSGQTLLYNPRGNLIFSGGITVGRGHEGESIGRQAIQNYLQTGNTDLHQTSVFGCLLTSAKLDE